MQAPIDLQRFVTAVVQHNPEYSGLRTTVEKELLHYEILGALSSENLLKDLTFQGGTCLRLVHQSRRLSEDLDFVGGEAFDYSRLMDIKSCIEDYIGGRYGVRVQVAEPAPGKLDGDGIKVGRWKVSVETQGEDKSAPWQKIKIEVANVPAHTSEPMPIRLNYPEVPGGYGTLLVNCESLEEILADKYLALTCRKTLKARDIWDIAHLRQRRVEVDSDLVQQKFEDYQETGSLTERLQERREALSEFINSKTFANEMTRFLVPKDVEGTLSREGFLPYLIQELDQGCEQVLDSLNQRHVPTFQM